jgi:hypothetical protein
MKKTLTALAAAAVVALAATAAPSPANAQCRGCAVGAGIIGGIAAGAIIGGAIANSGPPPAYGYGPAPAYGAPGVGYAQPVACYNGPGFWAPRQWVDRGGYTHVSDRQFFFCP